MRFCVEVLAIFLVRTHPRRHEIHFPFSLDAIHCTLHAVQCSMPTKFQLRQKLCHRKRISRMNQARMNKATGSASPFHFGVVVTLLADEHIEHDERLMLELVDGPMRESQPFPYDSLALRKAGAKTSLVLLDPRGEHSVHLVRRGLG